MVCRELQKGIGFYLELRSSSKAYRRIVDNSTIVLESREARTPRPTAAMMRRSGMTGLAVQDSFGADAGAIPSAGVRSRLAARH